MKYTSAEAAKLLLKLNQDLNYLEQNENNSKEFLAAVTEDIESVRPDYSYAETKAKIDEIQTEIRKLKHAINIFNTTYVIPDFNMTIDEMLVFIPQLSKKKEKLWSMQSKLPKSRESNMYSGAANIIDYRYLNYNLDDVKKDYNEVSDTLSKAQMALDLANSTETLDFDL